MTKLQALRALEAELSLVVSQYNASNSVDDSEQEAARKKRGLAQLSLVAIVNFLDTMDYRELTAGLRPLINDLYDIENGGPPPGWLRNAVPHAPSLPIKILVSRGQCAAVMELLMRSGRDRQSAAQFIVDHVPPKTLSQLARSTAHRTPNWRTVARWRDAVIGSADDTSELERYLHMLRVEALSTAKARAVLKALAKALSD